MTEESSKTFTPITTQEEFDEAIKGRLAREKDRWEKSSGVANLRQELESKEEELSDIRREQYLSEARRAALARLEESGHTESGKTERILRHLDLDSIEADEEGNPNHLAVTNAIADVQKDLPELFDQGQRVQAGAGSRGAGKPVVETEKALTGEELAEMSPEEVATRWDQVRAFLGGER